MSTTWDLGLGTFDCLLRHPQRRFLGRLGDGIGGPKLAGFRLAAGDHDAWRGRGIGGPPRAAALLVQSLAVYLVIAAAVYWLPGVAP